MVQYYGTMELLCWLKQLVQSQTQRPSNPNLEEKREARARKNNAEQRNKQKKSKTYEQ